MVRMESEPELTPAEKLRVALDLMEAGIALMRQNLRRRYPTESQQEIDQRLQAWLLERPPAELGEPSFRVRPERAP